jgi:hypothetical protein
MAEAITSAIGVQPTRRENRTLDPASMMVSGLDF